MANNKLFLSGKPLKIIIPILLAILMIIMGIIILKNKNRGGVEEESVLQYAIQKDDEKIEVSKEGNVRFSFGKKAFIQNWDKEKIDALYKYIKRNGKDNVIFLTKGDYIVVIIYEEGRKTTLYLPADDPEMEEIFDTFSGGGGGDQSGGGEDGIGDDGIFDFSSPIPIVTTTPASTGGGIVIPQKPDDCPLWLLSWCVYPHSPRPAATPYSTSTPASSVKPDCSYWLKDVQDKAIISNTLCIKPSPTP